MPDTFGHFNYFTLDIKPTHSYSTNKQALTSLILIKKVDRFLQEP